ncbi:hypothetical protein PHYSODRAFT_329010 [Phytophthora sojae]|uniref:Uncharacterized protein n=1 Tax=Phytophthora sojae (strain P6497) TaxID=1094619 RepID=G4Z642_PHYSP|nr:hypothetical protein PHYSODRAFT_329010 [Phytophthora sojae]EGZ20963.1 hypothetical protein PHYSODRAFT_329010 [Phytophthora sojae]|eukprot:XP_009523680.1 hypothetical protein PHYSODRAFT_329010 [Phytophthora sojae]
MKQKRSSNKRNIPWDADNSTPDGLSSLGVLLRWFSTPGNYANYHQGGQNKADAVQFILAAMEEHGIYHRTARGVAQKVGAIVQQYLAALKVMVDKDLLSAYVDQEDIDERVEAKIQQRCPHYRIVAPVLSQFNFCSKTPKDWTASNGSEDSDDVEQRTRTGASKRKGKAKSSAGLRSSKRRCSPHVEEQLLYNAEPDEGQDTVVECTDLVPREEQRAVDVPSLEHRRQTEECELQYVRKMTHRLLVHEREMQECELKLEQYRVEVGMQQAELEKRRSEMGFKVDTVLSRQTLKDRRVSKAEIDHILPLPEP